MNWTELLEANDIPFVTAGPNTGRGEVSIKCPFCGEADPSEHLGINLTTGFWSCWRDATHKGRSAYTLIRALLGCSYEQSGLIARQFSAGGVGTLAMLTPISEALRPASGPVALRSEFMPIEGYSFTHKYWKYLWKRGFDNPNAVIKRYQLSCCMVGKWKDRLIIPVFCDGLVGWQGRALASNPEAPRYLTSHKEVKLSVFNYDGLNGGRVLYVCEGPMDAMKLDFYGYNEGINATCCFGVITTPEQKVRLNELAQRFDRTIIVFDAKYEHGAFELSNWVRRSSIALVPEGAKDLGEMSKTQVQSFIEPAREV